MSGNVVNCCVFFFSRRYPWSGASVIGLIICRLRVMEHAPIVSGHGKRRWLRGKKTRIRDSWFGLRTKAHTCAISVLNHAQICHRKIPENSSSGRMKSVTISERRGWIHHNIGHKGLPGTTITERLGKIHGQQMHQLNWQRCQIWMLCKLELENCRKFWVAFNVRPPRYKLVYKPH